MKKILYADTTEIAKKTFDIVFSDLPWEFIYVPFGSEAIDLISSNKPDMIIASQSADSDFEIELYKHLRSIESTEPIPFILLNQQGRVTLDFKDDPHSASINKPFDISVLIAYIKFLFKPDFMSEILGDTLNEAEPKDLPAEKQNHQENIESEN